MANRVEFKGITKYFPGVKALDNISFSADGGEVLAIMGENGAGKSTLLKTLGGDYRQDSGEYLINGEPVQFESPLQAIAAGIGIVYQERQIVLELTVAENIMLGQLPRKFLGLVDMDEVVSKAQKIIDDFQLDINPREKVKNLSTAYQQMVEIIKICSRENLKVIAFDEPTASLGDDEVNALFRIIRKLRDEGKAVIYVSHRMKEMRQISDRVAIFKDGKYVGTYPVSEISDSELIVKMVGRDLGNVFAGLDKQKTIGGVLLSVKDVKSESLKECSFELRAGEVLGFSGLVGAGRTELMRAIVGADKMTGGEVRLEGRLMSIRSPSDAKDAGIVMVPEDRKFQGLLPSLSVGGNITIGSLKENSNRFHFMSKKKEDAMAEDGIRRFRVRTPDAEKKALELSGGNQQKCIVARWMATNPKVLILDEPTKGIDIGAKSEFYEMICAFAKQGLGVLLVSSELPEVIGLSDRIIVMHNRRIVGEVSAEEATEERLLRMAMIRGSA